MAQMVEYKTDDVLTAATRRVSRVFDEFSRIVVSVSSGKDSTVLYHLAIDEAAKRGRKVELFFLDQEAEYQSTVSLIEEMMLSPHVSPRWFQVPLLMTNATSHVDYFLDAWHEGSEWVRPKHELAIHETDGTHPRRFYSFFEWYEKQCTEPTAFLVGLRSKESLTRFRAVSNNPGYSGVSWSTKTKSPHAFRFYPIYDWTFGDVWKFIADRGVKYNRVYDWLFAKHGVNMSTMRVSNLIHEKSFHALADLQEFEPETYERLLHRLSGVHCAALYAKDKHVYSASERPPSFASWREYRDYLLASTPIDKAERFHTRFAKQKDDEATYQAQCKQLLLNDWENNIPVPKSKRESLKAIWWNRL